MMCLVSSVSLPPTLYCREESKRFDEEMAAVLTADDAKVFSSSKSPSRRPRSRGRKGGVFFGAKDKGVDRGGSKEGRGGYRQRRAAVSATASLVGRDGFFLSTGEECEMNPGDDEEKGEACDYDYQAEETALSRVGDLGRRIALRCLRMEQEYMRRERTQARLFEEQLRGARLVRKVPYIFYVSWSVVRVGGSYGGTKVNS